MRRRHRRASYAGPATLAAGQVRGWPVTTSAGGHQPPKAVTASHHSTVRADRSTVDTTPRDSFASWADNEEPHHVTERRSQPWGWRPATATGGTQANVNASILVQRLGGSPQVI
jgi:hypothetical protein